MLYLFQVNLKKNRDNLWINKEHLVEEHDHAIKNMDNLKDIYLKKLQNYYDLIYTNDEFFFNWHTE